MKKKKIAKKETLFELTTFVCDTKKGEVVHKVTTLFKSKERMMFFTTMMEVKK